MGQRFFEKAKADLGIIFQYVKFELRSELRQELPRFLNFTAIGQDFGMSQAVSDVWSKSAPGKHINYLVEIPTPY